MSNQSLTSWTGLPRKRDPMTRTTAILLGILVPFALVAAIGCILIGMLIAPDDPTGMPP